LNSREFASGDSSLAFEAAFVLVELLEADIDLAGQFFLRPTLGLAQRLEACAESLPKFGVLHEDGGVNHGGLRSIRVCSRQGLTIAPCKDIKQSLKESM